MADANESTPPIEAAIELVGRPQQLRGQAVHAAVDLGIVDALGTAPKSAGTIAADLDLSTEYTRRLFRALDVYGVLEREANGYSLTPVGERFRTDHPESVRDYVLFFYNPTRLAAVRHLPDIVTEGGMTGYHIEFEKSMFEVFDDAPAFSAQFNGMQDLSSLGETTAILDTLAEVDFSRYDTVCDVGGGYGDLISHLLDRNPGLRGIVLELPSVLADDERLWAPKVGVEDRCQYVAGDMFEEVPQADAYILKAILHDWSDAECVQILSTIHEGAEPDAELFVRERIVDEDEPDPATVDMDMWMMLETGGQERTREQFEALYDRSGWVLDDLLAVDEEISIMRCSTA